MPDDPMLQWVTMAEMVDSKLLGLADHLDATYGPEASDQWADAYDPHHKIDGPRDCPFGDNWVRVRLAVDPEMVRLAEAIRGYVNQPKGDPDGT